MREQTNKGKEGQAQFTTTSVEFKWADLPEEWRENARREIVERVIDTSPVEMLIESAVEDKLKEKLGDSSSNVDLEEAIVQCLTEEQIGRIIAETTDNGVMESITKGAENVDSTVVKGTEDKAGSEPREMIVEEVNQRIVAPLLFGTATILLFATIGAALEGSLLLALIIAPAPVATAYFLWKSSQI